MSNTKIRQIGDPILRETSREVSAEDFASGLVASTLHRLKEVLNGIKAISDENGNALSAPQVGVAIRMILLRIDGEFVPMINPQFVPINDERFMFEEECFSFYSLRAKVERFKSLELNFTDEHQQSQKREMNGEFAGLVQHEIDHLNGIFFVDRVEDKHSVVSIDYLFKDDPTKLLTVKQLCDYMAS